MVCFSFNFNLILVVCSLLSQLNVFFSFVIVFFFLQQHFSSFESDGIPVLYMSTLTEQGVMDVRTEVYVVWEA